MKRPRWIATKHNIITSTQYFTGDLDKYERENLVFKTKKEAIAYLNTLRERNKAS